MPNVFSTKARRLPNSKRLTRWVGGSSRTAAVLLLAALLLLRWLAEHGPFDPLRLGLFDLYQAMHPHTFAASSAVIVMIDDKSLQGEQWPWPRNKIATLLSRIAKAAPASITIDLLFPEPDRLSLQSIAQRYSGYIDDRMRDVLTSLPSNDALLATIVANAKVPIVLANAAENPGSPQTLAAAQRLSTLHQVVGHNPQAFLPDFSGLLANIDELEKNARFFGFVNDLRDDDGVLRRAPLLLHVGNSVVPSLALETLRAALHSNWFTVHADDDGINGVALGKEFYPTDADGTVLLYFSPSHKIPRYSAQDIIDGSIEPLTLQNKFVLIGVTALALGDFVATPLEPRTNGVEIHAQLLDNLVQKTRLLRPAETLSLELGVTFLGAIFLIVALPLLRPFRALGIWFAMALLFFSISIGAFYFGQLLLDPIFPTAVTLAVFLLMTVSGLEQQRFDNARILGELDAARRIQLGSLPDTRAITDLPSNLAVHARLKPAREVGGDLYDVFMLDRHRLFFLIGDVTDKGIPASLFMVLSKALCKSSVRRAQDSVAAALTTANREIYSEHPRHYPVRMFVTAVAGVIDTRDGSVSFCIAGHDAPYLVHPGKPLRRLEDEGGPPLCIVEDFSYSEGHAQLQAGDIIVLITDGVTEAHSGDHQLYGNQRVAELLAKLPPDTGPSELVESLYRDVRRHIGRASLSDDITIMAIAYQAPR